MADKRGGQYKTSKVTELPALPEALCRGIDPELFISDDSEEAHGGSRHKTEPAKAICRRCPERLPCLEYALANPMLSGVWGATTPKERQAMRVDGDGA